jgi:hypothetical protein
VYNSLNESLPQYTDLPKRLLRSAVIGFCASAISGWWALRRLSILVQLCCRPFLAAVAGTGSLCTC